MVEDGSVSMVRLSDFHERVMELRRQLRSAFVDQAPRLEMAVFRRLSELLLNHLLPLLQSDPGSCSGSVEGVSPHPAGIEATMVVQYYMQEIFAAALFLMEKSPSFSTYRIDTPPPPSLPGSEGDSTYYVSHAQRVYCTHMFLYLCFHPRVTSRVVIEALYPLFAPKQSFVSEVAPLENHIAPDILSSPRFRCKQPFLASVLSGVVFSAPDGVRSLIRVLLLDDRVMPGATMEAAGCVASVVTSSAGSLWVHHTQEGTVSLENITTEERMQLLSRQLLPLFLKSPGSVPEGDTGATLTGDEPSPSWMTKIHQANKLLPKETVGERLTICLALIANRMAELPSGVHSSVYRNAYRRFFFFNKYFLTPAFGALSLRSSAIPSEEEALLALRRICTLAEGVSYGVAPLALHVILEAVAPGILYLTSLVSHSLPETVADQVRLVWASLRDGSGNCDTLAHILVKGCAVSTLHSFEVTNRLEPRLEYALGRPSSTQQRVAGLRSAVFVPETPVNLQASVLLAVAAECQLRMVRAAEATDGPHSAVTRRSLAPHYRWGHNDTAGGGGAEVDDVLSAFLPIVEEVCVGLQAECIFGDQPSLHGTLRVLSTVAVLSPVCLHWALIMTPKLIAREPLSSYLDVLPHDVKSCELSKLHQSLRRFRLLLESLGADTADAGVEILDLVPLVLVAQDALQQAVEVVQAEEHRVSASGEAVDVSQTIQATWERLCDAAVAALDRQSTATLTTTLMQLSASVEEAAFSVTHPSTLHPTGQRLVPMLARVLFLTREDCAAVHAVKALAWLGMYRFDSSDTSFLSGIVCGVLTSSYDNCTSGELCRQLGLRPGSTDKALMARAKVRMLDVLLSWCDYDEDGRTLSHVDDYLLRVKHVSLYDVLAGLCQASEEAIVQVGALHLIGHFVCAIYPRVSLRKVCQLCADVFRCTPFDMSKAACASMLGGVTHVLEEKGVLTSLQDVDVAEIERTAKAMSSYYSHPPVAGGGAASHATTEVQVAHDEVIRNHGNAVCSLLKNVLPNALVLEAERQEQACNAVPWFNLV